MFIPLNIKALLAPMLAFFFLMPSSEAGQAGGRATGSLRDSIVFQLPEKHSVQSVGYYVAVEKGFYREAGLDVRLNEGGAGISPVEEVLAGRAQYAEGNHEVLIERLKNRPLVALAAILQHSPSVIVVRSDSSIRMPRDLVGKKGLF